MGSSRRRERKRELRADFADCGHAVGSLCPDSSELIKRTRAGRGANSASAVFFSLGIFSKIIQLEGLPDFISHRTLELPIRIRVHLVMPEDADFVDSGI